MGELAVATGPKGAVRLLQGVQAVAAVGAEWVREQAVGRPAAPPGPKQLRQLFERLGATYIKLGQVIFGGFFCVFGFLLGFLLGFFGVFFCFFLGFFLGFLGSWGFWGFLGFFCTANCNLQYSSNTWKLQSGQQSGWPTEM